MFKKFPDGEYLVDYADIIFNPRVVFSNVLLLFRMSHKHLNFADVDVRTVAVGFKIGTRCFAI